MRMNLLILGNGFDLAHDLKTKYKNFLDWAYKNVEMDSYEGFYWHIFWRNRYNLEMYPPKTTLDLPAMSYIKTMYKPGFEGNLFADKDNWIDLENNIAAIIKPWEGWYSEENRSQKCFKDILDKLILPKFEQYIASKINNDPIETLPHLAYIKYANRILNFNYSNTVERLYMPEAEICYVNGKALLGKKESNIVFGYDPSDNNGSEQWCEYDKVHQRAFKNTDTKYKEWLKDKNEYDIHIVGHSLGQTDSAFLEPFITKKNSKTIVYYHNLESKRQLIYKMMGIVGRKIFDRENLKFEPIDKFSMERHSFNLVR